MPTEAALCELFVFLIAAAIRIRGRRGRILRKSTVRPRRRTRITIVRARRTRRRGSAATAPDRFPTARFWRHIEVDQNDIISDFYDIFHIDKLFVLPKSEALPARSHDSYQSIFGITKHQIAHFAQAPAVGRVDDFFRAKFRKAHFHTQFLRIFCFYYFLSFFSGSFVAILYNICKKARPLPRLFYFSFYLFRHFHSDD